MDEKLKKFKIHAFLVKMPEVTHDEVVECWRLEEAENLAKNVAWDLYFDNEGTETIPSYEDLFDRFHAESYFMTEREFDMYLDDMYIRYIIKNVDYTVEEVDG